MKKIIALGAILVLLSVSCKTTNPPATDKGIQKNETTKTETVEKFNGKAAYVAISDFSILAKDKSYNFLSTEIPNDLASGFAKGGLVKPVERQELDKVIKEIKLSMSGLTDEDYSLQAGKLLGATYILLGSMSKITCRLIETKTSQIVYTESARGLYSNLFDVEDDLKGKIESYFKK